MASKFNVRRAVREDMHDVIDMIQELADFEKMSNEPKLKVEGSYFNFDEFWVQLIAHSFPPYHQTLYVTEDSIRTQLIRFLSVLLLRKFQRPPKAHQKHGKFA